MGWRQLGWSSPEGYPAVECEGSGLRGYQVGSGVIDSSGQNYITHLCTESAPAPYVPPPSPAPAPVPVAPAPAPVGGSAPNPGAVAVPFPAGAHYVTISGTNYRVTDASQGNSPEGWRVVVVQGYALEYLDGSGAVRTGSGELLGMLKSGDPPAAPGPSVPGPVVTDPVTGDPVVPAGPLPGGVDWGGMLARYRVPLLVGGAALVALNSGLLSGGPRRRR